MTTYNAGDTLPAGDITDDLIGAEVKFPHRGAAVVGKLADSRQAGERSVLYFGKFSVGFVILESQVVTVVSPPPVKVVQPEAPKVVDVWPYENTAWPYDDTPLRGWRWRDREGDYWEHQDGQWKVLLKGGWMNNEFTIPGNYLPLTRVGRK